MSGARWLRDAPCQGDMRFASAEGEVPDEWLAGQLLAVCQDCPFRAACIARVLPSKSRFDGVCGGRLWIDGQVRDACEAAEPRELAEPGSYIRHGTEAGARAHNRRGERACEFCRWSGRRATARRRAEARHLPREIGDTFEADADRS